MLAKKLCLTGWLVATLLAGACDHHQLPQLPLVTGRSLSTGKDDPGQDVGSLPVNIVASPDGRFIITTDAGYRQALWSINSSTGAGTSQVAYSNRSDPQAPSGELQKQAVSSQSRKSYGLYYGLAVAADGTVYAAQGAFDAVAMLHLGSDGLLSPQSTIQTRAKDFPAGLALDQRGFLYVANQSLCYDNPFQAAGSVAVYDRKTAREVGRYRFTDSFGGTSNYPLAIAARASGDKVYVASERDNRVYVLDARNPDQLALLAKVDVGAHPQAVLLNRDGSRLYVANADSDTVSIIDCATDRVLNTVLLRPAVVKDLPGCSPTGLALSPREDRLFVTLGDFNAVAVVDLRTCTAQGYIPTGWYPTAVVVAPDGQFLLVANAKGNKERLPNMMTDAKTGVRKQATSPLNLPEGIVQRIKIPDEDGLAECTAQVLRNNRLDDAARLKENPLAAIGRRAGKITHVLYIIKENRTYDQVLGDMPQANGDAELCLFGRRVTPNQHAIAERFGLMDNLYACGEVSGDGWCWSTESMANAYAIRNVPYHYSERGRKFDFEGQNNGYPTGGFPATDADGAPSTTNPIFKDGGPAIPDVAEPSGGHIWDLCSRNGISFRNYGFFAYFAFDVAGIIGGPENYPSSLGLQPAGHDLAGLTDLDFRRFDMNYADSDAPELYFAETGDANCLFPMRSYGKHKALSRFAEWNREFQMMLAKDPTGNAVPQVMFLRVPQDHTVGAKAGAHTPQSAVADNDYAVGQIVEAVSHSPIWKHCAILVVEDDAQSGADHVDAHRTTGFVISPYLKRGQMDHRFYNTNSFLRTLELLMDLPPMTQYDATATAMLNWTDEPENAEPFAAILPPRELIAERNPQPDKLATGDPRIEMARESAAMDFVHADAAPSDELNRIIWKTVKGPLAQAPQPRDACPFVRRPDPD